LIANGTVVAVGLALVNDITLRATDFDIDGMAAIIQRRVVESIEKNCA